MEGAFHLTLVSQGDKELEYLKSKFGSNKALERINHSII
jgi:hypothetical protein